MSWFSDIGSALGGAVSTTEGILTTTANAAHTLLGSEGSLNVGGLSLTTGVTQGDVATTNTNVNAVNAAAAAASANAFTGFINELTSNPILLIGIVVLIILLVGRK